MTSNAGAPHARGDVADYVAAGLYACTFAFVLCLASGTLKSMGGEIVPIWIVDGYLVAHLMVTPGKRKFTVLAGGTLGILGANFWVGESVYVASSFTFAGFLEICIATALAPRVTRAKDLSYPRSFLQFLLGSCIASLSSGAAALVLLGGFFTVHPFSSFSNWVISDALGFLIFTPTSLVVASGELIEFWKCSNRNWSLLLLGILGVVTALIFCQTTYDLLYWILPPLAVLAFQTELAVVLIGTLLCISIAVPLTVHGTGPLWLIPYVSMQARVLALQMFVLAALSVTLPIALMQAQRNRLLSLLANGERRYRMLAENADDVVLQISPSGEIRYVSPRVEKTLGFASKVLLGCVIFDLIREEDRLAVVQAISNARAHVAETSVIYRIRRSDDALLWVRSFISAGPIDASSNEALLACTIRDIDATLREQHRREADETELKRLAYVDSLTGLFNRRYFDAQLTTRFGGQPPGERAQRIALLLADIDHFKKYNDTYGHQAGDECLKAVASCIAQAMRDGDIVARHGGEEFAMVLGSNVHEDVVSIAERVRAGVETLRLPHDVSPLGIVTVSVGIAHALTVETNALALFREADKALYVAKRAGRNQVR